MVVPIVRFVSPPACPVRLPAPLVRASLVGSG